MRPVGRDPAPSRLAYRLHRLWLTPFFRRLLRLGLPVFLVIFAAGWFLADSARLQAVRASVSDLRRSIAEQPEFSVRRMAVEGASEDLDATIRDIVPVEFPVGSFELELGRLRRIVTGLDAVKDAALRVRPGGVLEVRVEERQPAVVWRRRGGLTLLDAGGHRVEDIARRADRPALPVVAGAGADAAVAEALRLHAAAGPIAGRLRGMVRRGERRWDLVLDRDQRIQLPAEAPEAALERVIALDRARDLLARDVLAVDMRLADRPTLRLSPEAVTELRQMRRVNAEGTQG